VTLKTPVGPNDHAMGSADAPVTLLEYGDFQCPYCGQAYPIVKSLQKRFGTKLRFVFRHMPLKNAHPQAELAAQAAEAAARQGQFWQMHDALYEHQAQLGPEFVVNTAGRLHLDVAAFERDLVSADVQARVQHDFMDGVRSGVNGTPTFYLNGTRFDESWDPETLGAAIEAAIEGGAHRSRTQEGPGNRPNRSTKRS
jgi:protein-disulfide isomerase